MGFFSRMNPFRNERRDNYPDKATLVSMLNAQSVGTFNLSYAQSLSAVYRAVNAIANAVSCLPLELYLLDENEYRRKARGHYLYHKLKKNPNPLNSTSTLLKLIVFGLHFNGDAFVTIERDILGKIKNFWFVPKTQMEVHYDERLRFITYRNGLTGEMYETNDVIHIMNYTKNGYIGQSTLSYAASTLTTAYNAEKHAGNFFKGGANQAGIMTMSGNPNPKATEAAKKEYLESIDTGLGTSNSVSFLPGDFKYTPIQINAKDAQLLETRKFSVIEIARFFDVPPSKLFDDSQTKYDNVEAANLTFLADAVLPTAHKIATEFERKIAANDEEVAFDTNKFLDADKDSQANYFQKMHQTGGLTTNEIRKQTGKPPVKGGDSAMVQVNMQPLETALKNENDKGKKNQ